ncbi:MAG: phenylalanine--tRNA ligase subunit alpha [Gemmatimonadaceae bacterium]|nr:phenylalanine--tRNA ligase subunit alpha [Gemmatimonadaceae bacterium]
MTDVTLDAFLAACRQLAEDAPARIDRAATPAEFADVRTQLVGRKQGRLADLMAQLATLPPDARREAGRAINEVKADIEQRLDAREAAVAAAARGAHAIDPSMPARRRWQGSLHPVTLVIDEIADIFRELGFTIALGPEAETEFYNFTALNFPADHPAMELHDTLYLANDTLLRTHTSPVQVRTLQQYAPPVRVLAPGNVYRRDFFDATHAPAFMQLEGLAIDEGISFVDLKATLSEFARRFYGGTRRVRFGPSYFPFVEPGAQMDVEVDLGDGKGTRWVEILGCGMVHPNVLDAAGIDSERYTGWAFGMGPARIAMSRHGIPDIRVLYDSDVRFLEQFAR